MARLFSVVGQIDSLEVCRSPVGRTILSVVGESTDRIVRPTGKMAHYPIFVLIDSMAGKRIDSEYKLGLLSNREARSAGGWLGFCSRRIHKMPIHCRRIRRANY